MKQSKLFILTFSALILNFCYFLHHVYLVFTYPFSINHVEGATWASIVCSKTVGLYPNFQLPPYLPTSYPPLFYLLALPLHNLLNLGLNAGRIISLASSLSLALLIAHLAYLKSQNRFFGLIMFFAFIATANIFYWGTLYRIDMLLLLLIGLALYFGLAMQRDLRYQLFALAFLSLAFFTKSTCLIPIAAIFTHWGIEEFKTKRSLFKTISLGGLWALSLTIIFTILQIATGGRYSQQVFGLMSSMTTFTLVDGFNLFMYFIKLYWPLLVLSLYILFLTIYKKRLSLTLAIAYLGLLASLSFIFIAGSRIGSDTNYYLEAYLWLFLIVCFSLPILWSQKINQLAIVGAIFIFTVISTPVPFNPISISIFNPAASMEYLGKDKMVKNEIIQIIRQSPKDVLTGDASLAILAGKTPVFEPYILNWLESKGEWKKDQFVNEIKSGQYEYIAMAGRYKKIGFINKLAEKYYKKIAKLKTTKVDNGAMFWEIYKFEG